MIKSRVSTVAASDYLPLPKGEGYDFQNRFVGDYLLYGSGTGWGYAKQLARSPLFLVRWIDGANYQLTLTHGIDRIEQMGRDALVVGTDGKNLHFTSVRLGGSPVVADSYLRKAASQGRAAQPRIFL
jgi:hypothetical protein